MRYRKGRASVRTIPNIAHHTGFIAGKGKGASVPAQARNPQAWPSIGAKLKSGEDGAQGGARQRLSTFQFAPCIKGQTEKGARPCAPGQS